ncbi:hypothetical protein FPZ47_13820 [Mycobacterium helveticum]|uniref:Uncharacterized protein n=1 Tax=Mycobacterium helveticum TaxID=2592811 RepID=A0A557XRK0_9MYCO|nr:hypothetical protein FPZ46_16345 [Mycobacterium helveticum]TVS88562.1 hypothetical protein FPZ47_13820 [Mycobacterium helveticum]
MRPTCTPTRPRRRTRWCASSPTPPGAPAAGREPGGAAPGFAASAVATGSMVVTRRARLRRVGGRH